MLARLAPVVLDVRVRTAGVFECIGEDVQTVEGTVGVNGLGEVDDPGGQPGGGDRHRAENAACGFARLRFVSFHITDTPSAVSMRINKD